MNDHLRRAMRAVEEDDGAIASAGLAAVSSALIIQHDDDEGRRRLDDERHRLDEEARARADVEAQRERDFDAAMGDVVELVARHRARLGRKSCSQHDGATIRKIFALLRNMVPADD
jgi:hypothetical protein